MILAYYLSVLRSYAFFSGRARRSEYWSYALVNFVVIAAIQLLVVVARANGGVIAATPFMILSLIYSLGTFVPSIAVAVRRLHDTGRSGWWLLIGLVPLLGAIVLIVFFVFDSVPGTNRWGSNPKEMAVADPAPFAIEPRL